MKPEVMSMRVYWVRCSRCEADLDLGAESADDARREARNAGWVSNRHGGWICDSCRNAREEQRAS